MTPLPDHLLTYAQEQRVADPYVEWAKMHRYYSSKGRAIESVESAFKAWCAKAPQIHKATNPITKLPDGQRCAFTPKTTEQEMDYGPGRCTKPAEFPSEHGFRRYCPEHKAYLREVLEDGEHRMSQRPHFSLDVNPLQNEQNAP